MNPQGVLPLFESKRSAKTYKVLPALHITRRMNYLFCEAWGRGA